MVIFHSYVSLPEGILWILLPFWSQSGAIPPLVRLLLSQDRGLGERDLCSMVT